MRHLITLGSPHTGTEISRVGIGHPTRELVLGSALLTRLAAAPPPSHTRVTVVWSHGDALVPGARQLAFPGAEIVMYPDLGHVALLGSRRVAVALIERLSQVSVPDPAEKKPRSGLPGTRSPRDRWRARSGTCAGTFRRVPDPA